MKIARQIPLAVYVLWHPDFVEGTGLARTLYDWLSASTPQLRWSGLGVPVIYRTGATPRQIPVHGPERIVVVALVDEHWVADRAWREFLKQPFCDEKGQGLGLDDVGCHGKVLVLPTMLHPSAARIRELDDCNFLIPDPPTKTPDTAPRKLRLRRQVTQAIGRWMLAHDAGRITRGTDETDAEAGARHVVFISHAKADGLSIARALREEVMSYGQLRPFFDENDLPLAVAWRRRLEVHSSHSDSLIAVVTDAYAGRPWCRAELLMARTPRRLPNTNVWMIRPVVAVDALEKEFTTAIPELGSVPTRRWSSEIATEILDRLVLERLLTECHARIAASLEQKPGRHFITWSPDLPTIASLLAEVRAGDADKGITEVAYSGHGLRQSEIARLTNTFADIRWRTYDEVRPGGASRSPRRDATPLAKPVAFSVGNPPDQDLYARGSGPEHFHEAIVRVGRAILELGCPIAWGGTATKPSGPAAAPAPAAAMRENFTVTLREIARNERLLDTATSPVPRLEHPLFYSYLSANSRTDLDACEIANDLELCAYALVPPRTRRPGRRKQDAKGTIASRWVKACALTEMRRCMVATDTNNIDGLPMPPPAARIVAGGKTASYEGVLPGVIEEALYALEHKIPIYVIGGFGGAAALLAAALIEKKLPPPLSFAQLSKDPDLRRTIQAYKNRGDVEGPERLLNRLKAAIRQRRVANGLTDDENKLLASTTDIAEIVRMIRKGVATRMAASPACA